MMCGDRRQLMFKERIAETIQHLPGKLRRTIDSSFQHRHDFLEQQAFQPYSQFGIEHGVAHCLEAARPRLNEQRRVRSIEDTYLTEKVRLYVRCPHHGGMLDKW